MALTLERPADKSNNLSSRIDHLLYILINRWTELETIREELSEMDSYEVMDFFFEWKKTDHLMSELNSMNDGGELDKNQIIIYHALQDIIIQNTSILEEMHSRFSFHVSKHQPTN